jgi:hypothetical protein
MDPPFEAPGEPALEIRTLRVDGAAFCVKRGRKCRRPGVRLQIDLSRTTAVTGALSRRPPRGSGRARSFGRVNLGNVLAGSRTLSFSRTAAGKRLTPGRYSLTLQIGDSAPRTLRFKVRA